MISMHPGFGLFSIFPIMFFVVFALVLFIIGSALVKNMRLNKQNNASPRLACDATIVAKRTKVWGDHSHTTYFATFQFESGDRLELEIPFNQFGYLVEGDRGKLTFQGTRFLEFQRT